MLLLLNTILLEPNRWTAGHDLTRPLVDLLESIAAARFVDLELWGYHVDRLEPAQIDALAEALGAHALRVVAVGAYPSFHLEGEADEEERARLDRIVGVSARLGAGVFKIFPGRVASGDAGDQVWRRSVERLRQLAAQLAEQDTILTLETHGGTLCDSLEGTRRLLDDLADAGNAGVCFQPYADHDTGAAMAAFDELRPRVRHLHLQNRGPGRAVTLLEEGDWIDYARFLPHVRAAGFDGPLSIEFTAGITPGEGESFDVAAVLANAARDRRFIERVWSA